jgi:hypothetical protein
MRMQNSRDRCEVLFMTIIFANATFKSWPGYPDSISYIRRHVALCRELWKKQKQVVTTVANLLV